MTDYNRITDYATKDGLPSGNTLKIVRGTEIHNEFNAIETAVNSKANINSPTFTGTVSIPAFSGAFAGTISGGSY